MDVDRVPWSTVIGADPPGADLVDERLEVGSASPSARNGTSRRTGSRSLVVPAPSRAPRRSQACAANISSIETTRAPSSTIASSRRAASGAIVIRSSIPSAWVVETSSNETGWARRRASDGDAPERRCRTR